MIAIPREEEARGPEIVRFANHYNDLGRLLVNRAGLNAIGHNLPVSMPHVDPAALLTQRVVLCRALEG